VKSAEHQTWDLYMATGPARASATSLLTALADTARLVVEAFRPFLGAAERVGLVARTPTKRTVSSAPNS
jgi:hypothetical protein